MECEPKTVLTRIRRELSTHATFWVFLGAGIYVLFFVPHIYNLMFQAAHTIQQTFFYFGFVAYVSLLLLFYFFGLFVVMKPQPLECAREPVRRALQREFFLRARSPRAWWTFCGTLTACVLALWILVDRTWGGLLFAAIAALLLCVFAPWVHRLADGFCAWLPGLALTSAPPRTHRRDGMTVRHVGGKLYLRLYRLVDRLGLASRPRASDASGQPQAGHRPRRFAALFGYAFAIAGAAALLFGSAPDSSRWYSLAGVFCRNAGVLLLAIGCWLIVLTCKTAAALTDRGEQTSLQPVVGVLGISFGRVLGWLTVATVFSELVWFLASSLETGYWVSYRLYTIWAAVHLFWVAVVLGLFVDRWHHRVTWPLRPVAYAVALGITLWSSQASSIDEGDVERHLTDTQLEIHRAETPSDGTDLVELDEDPGVRWFEGLLARVRETPVGEGPVVVVAASGGGSRAAIFTALTLEALERTPLATDSAAGSTRNWADNIVLVSSVSGGSLAAAYWVHGLGRGPAGGDAKSRFEVERLVNTTQSELAARTLEDLRQRLSATEARQVERLGREFDSSQLDVLAQVEEYIAFLEDKIAELDREIARAERAAGGVDERTLAADPSAAAEELLADYRERDLMLGQYEAAIAHASLLSAQDLAERLALEYAGSGSSDGSPPAEEQRWIFHSAFFDSMCLDFMAPIFRGFFSFRLDRGDSLAKFWTDAFAWEGSVNTRGYASADDDYAGEGFDPGRYPRVILNASDVLSGSRLAIGFPRLPRDLWSGGLWDEPFSDLSSLEGLRPESLHELSPGFPVSLSRAVRLSSNFPWGFEVQELPVTRPRPGSAHRRTLRVLDGGVVDNTGLDTLFHVFESIRFHAEARVSPGDSALVAGENLARRARVQRAARSILEELRRRGVVLLEIDSESKPSQSAPGPLQGGIIDPIRALGNAGYLHSERAKGFYVRRIGEFIAGESGKELVLHYRFQSNHVLPDESAADSQVLTAWSLGPADKASIVGRFLIELGLWERRHGKLSTMLAREIEPEDDAERAKDAGANLQRQLDIKARVGKQYFGKGSRD